jgi:hypothetical protein
MPDLRTLLDRIPDEFKPLAGLGIAAFILVFLVLLHGAGLHGVLVLHKRRVRRFREGKPRLVRAMFLFGWAIFLMLALHIAEFAIWAYSLLYLGLIPRAYNAIFFAASAYTTLGFGNVDLEDHWRNIAPVIGISGLFTFAWTTSALVSVVSAHSELIGLLEDEREREIKMRFDLQKDEWNALQREWHAERSEKENARTQAAAGSFWQRRKIWKDERTRVKKLRETKLAEIAELRRKERQEEEHLGGGVPPDEAGGNK